MTETKEKEKRAPRIGRLTSVGFVGIEIAKIYRATRHNKLNSADGMRMVQMLLGLKSCLESSEIERRLVSIEAALTAQNIAPRVAYLKAS